MVTLTLLTVNRLIHEVTDYPENSDDSKHGQHNRQT
jgi:hypothetical protein